MGTKHQKRIEELLAHRQIALYSQELSKILSFIHFVEFLGFVDNTEQVINAELIWDRIARVDAAPSTEISAGSSFSDLTAWLIDGVDRLGKGKEYYLSVASYNSLPWAKVRVVDGGMWLPILWQKLNKGDIVVLSSDQKLFFGVTEEEDEYYGYINNMHELGE